MTLLKKKYCTGKGLERESYDIFVRLNESDKENELVKVEHKDDIVKRIIDDYKRNFKEYDKALDELLEEK